LESIGTRALALTVRRNILKERHEPAKPRVLPVRYSAEIKEKLPDKIRGAIQKLHSLTAHGRTPSPEEIAVLRKEWAGLYKKWEPLLYGSDQEDLLESTNQRIRELAKNKNNLRERLAPYIKA
jgi:hypothetical protein